MDMNPTVVNDLIVLALMGIGFTAGLILACRFAFKKPAPVKYETFDNRNRL